MAFDLFGPIVEILVGDALETLRTLPAQSVQTCVTSPPYFGLRDYGHAGQVGLEETPELYVARLVEIFREVRRVLRDDGTLWLNLGDSWARTGGTDRVKNSGNTGYTLRTIDLSPNRKQRAPETLSDKDLIGIPWRVALALQADGWILRQDIIWAKPNPMPESVTDRCTKAHEYIFLFSKRKNYFFDAEAIREPAVWAPSRQSSEVERGPGYYAGKWAKLGTGNCNDQSFKAIRETRNKRSVWTVSTKPYKGAHFATFPPDLIEPCVLAGAPRGGIVLDPFAGSGTTGMVAKRHDREAILIELNPDYVPLIRERLK